MSAPASAERPWSEADDAHLRRMYFSGEELPAIALTLARTSGEVWRRIFSLGLKGGGHRRPPIARTDTISALPARALQLFRKERMDTVEIGRALGVPEQEVCRLLQIARGR